jgi:hypothetical protein
MKQLLSGLFLIGATVFFSTCKKGSEDFTLDYQYEYFPVDSGRFWIYKVDSVMFREGNSDTSVFYVKELIESIYPDNIGRPTARIERFRSNDSLGNWFITDVWFATRTQITAEKIEENLKFVKILFPPKEGQTWKGNKYIEVTNNIEWMEDWEYELQTLNVPKTIGNISFDSTLTVLQYDDENLIEKSLSTETYAEGVGLAYKELLHLTKEDVTAPWTQPKEGFVLKMTIVDYGN